jgi:zinc/manganese transport system substrate-binding protein
MQTQERVGTSYFLAGVLVIIVLVVGTSAGFYVLNRSTSSSTIIQSPTSKVRVVASENFWGSLVSQLGGIHVQVLSIVSDPNADPHQYESNTADARAFANASLVIVNGAGYDTWAGKLIGASNNPNQKVLNVADLLGKRQGDNPHFWYSPAYVNKTVNYMYSYLIAIDPTNAAYYKQQYVSLNGSLGQYMSRIIEIRQQFAGTRVAATENIFVYLADAAGLNLVSPPEFMQAVAEGNDPPANSVVQFQELLQRGNASSGGVNLLVYNLQTVTPLTQSIKALAAQKNIPTVGLTETIQPPNVTFQTWMNAECIALQNALNQQALGK